jgi:hypothetical protein
MKIAARLRNVIRQHRRNGPWEYLIAGQKEKLWRLVDPYRRWMKREARILEAMNRSEFRRDVVYDKGFAWGYTMNSQVAKVRLRLLPAPPNERSKRRGWQASIIRGYNRVSAPVEQADQVHAAWEYVIGGTLRKLYWTLDPVVAWDTCIHRTRRRKESSGME